MKIQALAVIAIIIILPMSILLTAYSAHQIETLNLQLSYDTKLTTSTHDAITAFQLNMSNSTTSNITNSKMRDIEASVNTFYTSLATNFSLSGYDEDVLEYYVPAIVYTMYDGFYIYSEYTNTLSTSDDPSIDPNWYNNPEFYEDSYYKDGEILNGLKPYVYYSQRYIKGNIDIVITYSLDSYITIQGKINDEVVNDAGYLLTGVDRLSSGTPTYRGISILPEQYNATGGLTQQVYIDGEAIAGADEYITLEEITGSTEIIGSLGTFEYIKQNGVKYYHDEANNEVFSLLNEQKYVETNKSTSIFNSNNLGAQYYNSAYDFKQRIITEYPELLELSSLDAVDESGNGYLPEIYTNYMIFAELENSAGEKYIEDEDSEFNAHKRAVIQNVIETNLLVAISNYNRVGNSIPSYSMPKLEEHEWDQITQDISMITFMQGMNIGGREYNGYAVVSNALTQEYVSEDSIYLLNTLTDEYYKVTDPEISTILSNGGETIGMFNIEFERRMVDAVDGDFRKTIYYYPKEELASYTSVVNSNTSKTSEETIDEYLIRIGNTELARIYYTALGRERIGLYRTLGIFAANN